MANKKFLLGMLVLTLVFGMVVIGCGVDEDEPSLNGTWVSETEEQELMLDNGDFEISYDGKKAMKGTYTTKDDKITITVTHIHGDFFSGMEEFEGFLEIVPLESKWYSKSEFKGTTYGIFIVIMGYEEMIDQMFLSMEGTYTLSGDKLTLTMGGESINFTRKK